MIERSLPQSADADSPLKEGAKIIRPLRGRRDADCHVACRLLAMTEVDEGWSQCFDGVGRFLNRPYKMGYPNVGNGHRPFRSTRQR